MALDFSSFEIWRGPSLLTGEPVVALASGLGLRSANPKTGAMVQVYFLKADVDPRQAAAQRRTHAICGDCTHAPHRDGTCYVNTGYGIQNLWLSWRAGNCPPLHEDLWPSRFRGRHLRIGAYGDPAAAPDAVSFALAEASRGHTGYTHAWRDRPGLRRICMASVSSEAEMREAESTGWRAFRVVAMDGDTLEYLEPVPRDAVPCGASLERGKRTTCIACGACSGLASKAKASIVVGAHGMNADRFAAARGLSRPRTPVSP